ncbi:protein of unknown function [Cupriavidus taiwanensis]|nr:protein of unknown function [Cupriavidus taiwanensis]
MANLQCYLGCVSHDGVRANVLHGTSWRYVHNYSERP